jgi:hypothetical protein
MRAWCPRCDAVRPGETTCPACGAPLATLEDPVQAAPGPDLPAPEEPPAPPPAASRLRIALTAATLVVAGIAFVAGRSVARTADPEASQAAPATTTTVPEPGADARELGWTARHGGITVTAVEANRFATDDRDTVAVIRFRVQGLPAGQRVLALQELHLIDAGGGQFASVDRRQFGREGGVPLRPDERDPDTYTLVTGPAPRLSALDRIDLDGLVLVRLRDQAIELDTGGAWPTGQRRRTIDPGPQDAVRADLGFQLIQGIDLELRVTSAFVGGGQAVVVLDASSSLRGAPAEAVPLSAELRAGGRVLCARTLLLGREGGQRGTRGLVLACATRPVPRLTLAVGVGARPVPFKASLRP